MAQADIIRSYEEYLDIFGAFCADDIEGRNETLKEPTRAKDRVGSVVSTFVAPRHALAEARRSKGANFR